MEGYSRKQVCEILGVPPGKLRYWERLGLAVSQEGLYSFADLAHLRTLDRLTRRGLKATRLAESVPPDIRGSLARCRVDCNGKQLVLFKGSRGIEVGTGQYVLSFQDSAETAVPLRVKRDWMALSEEARKEGRLEDALEAARQAVVAEPLSLAAHNQCGLLLLDMGRSREAVEAFKQALELSPSQPRIRFNLANALDDLGRVEEADDQLARAVSLDPGFADAHFNRALVLEKLNRPWQARHHWKEYLRLDPVGPWAEQVRKVLNEGRPGHGAKVVPLHPGCR